MYVAVHANSKSSVLRCNCIRKGKRGVRYVVAVSKTQIGARQVVAV